MIRQKDSVLRSLHPRAPGWGLHITYKHCIQSRLHEGPPPPHYREMKFEIIHIMQGVHSVYEPVNFNRLF